MKFKFLRTLVILFLAVELVGCASPVVKDGKYEGLTNSDPSKATIFVYRDSSFAGAMNQYDVLIDGVLSGSLPNGSFFIATTEPGEKNIKADTGKFGKGSSILVEKGKAYCLKMTLNFCVSCKSADIDTVDNARCDKEIKSLAKVSLK